MTIINDFVAACYKDLPEATTSIEQDLARLDRVLVINRGGNVE